MTTKQERNIEHEGWNINIQVTEDGFTIYGTRPDGPPMGSISVEPGDLKGAIERMKSKIDKRNVALKENAKELNAVIPPTPEDEVPF